MNLVILFVPSIKILHPLETSHARIQRKSKNIKDIKHHDMCDSPQNKLQISSPRYFDIAIKITNFDNAIKIIQRYLAGWGKKKINHVNIW